MHGGAAEGGGGSVLAPDVKEDGGTSMGKGLRVQVVFDEEFEGVGVVVLAHLLFLFPA